MTLKPEELAQIRDLSAKAAVDKKLGAETQRKLTEATKVKLFEYRGFTLKLIKLPFPVFLRFIPRIPEILMNPPPCPDCEGEGRIVDPAAKAPRPCEKCLGEGVYLPDDALTPQELADLIEVMCEALSAASADGLTPEQIGRMTPPEFPEDFIGVAFKHLLLMNSATKKQLQQVNFFRGKP